MSSRRSATVTKEDCEAQMTPLRSEVATMKEALVGKDLRGGMVADVASIKSDITVIKKYINGETSDQKKKGRDWRLLGFGIGSSALGGVIVATFVFLLHLLH